MVTISQVAERAQVSIATVSRTLRGLEGVSEPVREKVRRAAAELKYVPSPHATRLAGGKTRTIGAVLPWPIRWFAANTVNAAEEILSAAGYDTLLYSLGRTETSRRMRLDEIDTLVDRVDGLMVISADILQSDIERINGFGIPVASTGMPAVPWPNPSIDDVDAARKATEHLIALGHRRIAFFSEDTSPVRAGYPIYERRRQGYHQALADAGIDQDPDIEFRDTFDMAGGTRAMRAMLDAFADPTQVALRPTALFAGCDAMAFGAMRALREAGLRVPEDISIIGIDDHEMAEIVGLTTVGQPIGDEGAALANLLLSALDPNSTRVPDAREAGLPPVPTHLIERTSTRPISG